MGTIRPKDNQDIGPLMAASLPTEAPRRMISNGDLTTRLLPNKLKKIQDKRNKSMLNNYQQFIQKHVKISKEAQDGIQELKQSKNEEMREQKKMRKMMRR